MWKNFSRAALLGGAVVAASASISAMPIDHLRNTSVSQVEDVRLQREAAQWQTYVEPEYGTTVEYPAGIFAPAGPPGKGTGQRFESEDGRAILTIYSQINTAHDTPAS